MMPLKVPCKPWSGVRQQRGLYLSGPRPSFRSIELGDVETPATRPDDAATTCQASPERDDVRGDVQRLGSADSSHH